MINQNRILLGKERDFLWICGYPCFSLSTLFWSFFPFPPADQLGWIPSFPPRRLSSSHWGKLSFVDTATVKRDPRHQTQNLPDAILATGRPRNLRRNKIDDVTNWSTRSSQNTSVFPPRGFRLCKLCRWWKECARGSILARGLQGQKTRRWSYG